jgi:hypothetical protein
VDLLGLLLRRGESLWELWIEDIETQPGELFDATGKVTLLLNQVAGGHDIGVIQGESPKAE